MKVKFSDFLAESLNTDYTNNLKVLYLNNGFTPKDIKDIESEGYFSNVEWVDENTIKVYRNITILPEEYDEYVNNIPNDIGLYWSFTPNINAVWGERGDEDDSRRIEIQCVGHLNIKDIDFEGCLYALNDDFYNFCSEKEIRGKNNSDTISIIKCYKA